MQAAITKIRKNPQQIKLKELKEGNILRIEISETVNKYVPEKISTANMDK